MRKEMPERMSEDMPDRMPMNVRRDARKNQKICQKFVRLKWSIVLIGKTYDAHALSYMRQACPRI